MFSYVQYLLEILPPIFGMSTLLRSLLKDYASKYKNSNFQNNMKRILKRFKEKTGQFKGTKNEIEPWKCRGKNNSTGWNLLLELRMNSKSNAKVNAMTINALWKSNTHFKCYPLDHFKKYVKEMGRIEYLNKTAGKTLTISETIERNCFGLLDRQKIFLPNMSGVDCIKHDTWE